MKLLALILVVSCVIAYAAAGKSGRNIRKPIFTFSRRFRREADLEDPITADLENNYSSQISFDGYRWKREAEPHFRLEAEKQLAKDGFINGYVDLQRGVNSHGIPPFVGFRFRREAEEVEETEDENRV